MTFSLISGWLPTWWQMLLVPCPIYPQLTPAHLSAPAGTLGSCPLTTLGQMSFFLISFVWRLSDDHRHLQGTQPGKVGDGNLMCSGITLNQQGLDQVVKCQPLACSEWFLECLLYQWAPVAHSGNNSLIKYVLYWLFPLPVLLSPLPPVCFSELLPV